MAGVSWSEDAVHRWLSALGRPRTLSGSRGHDAAVLTRIRNRPVVCVDQTIEGVHFESDAAPAGIGRKAAARALSDLAATAARPIAILVALSAPRDRGEAWIRSVLSGARAAARACGADLVGGDLACVRGPACLSVTAVGETTGLGRAPGRDRARPGQALVLTGPVGGSRLGRHLRIRPRLRAGQQLHGLGATAMMDVSDGLAWDLHRLARASGIRIDLDLDRVPIHRDARAAARGDRRDALDHALHDGEDHELVATIPERRVALARSRIRGLVRIGRVSRGSGVWLHGPGKDARRWKPSAGGWKHGA
jgi:thiamine-monophosphate kinase